MKEEGNFEGTSFRLLEDLNGVCFSRWVLEHVCSRDVALPWLRRVITAQSIVSFSIVLQPRISEIRKVVVVTPGTFGEQKKNMFGTLGRRKSCCKGTVRLS